MHRLFLLVPFLVGSCALRAASPTAPQNASTSPLEPVASSTPAAAKAEAPSTEESESETDDQPVVEEAESREPAADGAPDGPRYTEDLSDEDLQEKWKSAPEALGCISIGFADEGRLINAEQFPPGDDWIVVSPGQTWATPETVSYVAAAIRNVRARHPHAPRLRVNQMSAREGGYLRPHKSHQSGRDVDLGFYYPTEEPVRVREREKRIDVALNWELVKSLVTLTDVQMILVDRRVQKVLYEYALRTGEDKDWLDSLFRSEKPLVQHARRHRDHFHVRFYSPRSQELGRRVAPLLAQRPEQNVATHRVRKGDTLGGIARRYGSSVESLRKVNHMRGSFLRLSQVLRVPLKGPCTRCPVPPPLVVPPRRLPPAAQAEEVAGSAPKSDRAGATVLGRP